MIGLFDRWSSSVTKQLMIAPLMLYGHPLMDGPMDCMLVICLDELVDVILVRCMDEPLI